MYVRASLNESDGRPTHFFNKVSTIIFQIIANSIKLSLDLNYVFIK
jgi:hypothetical protein